MALHYNENSERQVLTDGDGSIRCEVLYPKAKHKEGGYSLRQKKEKSTYGQLVSKSSERSKLSN